MANQSIDPALLALQTAKKALPASPSTQQKKKPFLQSNMQQSQAPFTTSSVTPAKIGGISSPFGAANINSSPVLGGATPTEIGTRAKELQSLPKAMPETGAEPKVIKTDELKGILDKMPDNESRKIAIQKLQERGYTIEGLAQGGQSPKEPSTMQNIAGGLVQSVAGLPSLGAKIVKPIFGAADKYIVDPLSRALGVDEAKIQANTARAEQARSNVIGGLGAAGEKLTGGDPESTAFKTTKFIGDIGQTALLPGVPGVTKGAGFVKGAGQLALQGLGETAKYTAIADQRLPTMKEAGIGAGGAMLIGGLSKAPALFKKTPPDVNKVVGKIIQGKEKDIKPAIETLSQINTKGVKTYKELGSRIKEGNQKLMQSVDEVLSRDTRNVTPEMFTKTVKAGDQVVSKDYMSDVIDNLTELYTKGGDIDKQAKILNVKELYKKGALRLKDANDLLRVYSSEFGDKAFSKATQEPLTSVSAQQYENIRKGAKELLRSQFADDGLKKLDEAYSKSAKTLEFINKMSEKVNALQQKVQERGFIENVTRKLGRGVDLITGGGVRGFLTSFLPSNIGNKVLNSLDLQEQLAKNLDDFARAIGKLEKGTASKVDLDLIKKYANTVSTASITSMGKPPQVK